MPDPITTERATLRKQLRARRNVLTAEQQQAAAQAVCQQLCAQAVFQQAQHLAVYVANDGELDPSRLMKTAHAQGKQLYLPVVDTCSKQMVFQAIYADSPWETNRFGINQPLPDPNEQRPAQALDLICMPLVGFDRFGSRLGMGGGFYDRALASLSTQQPARTSLIGLAHSCQEVERLPIQAWDIPMHAIATEAGFFWLTQSVT